MADWASLLTSLATRRAMDRLRQRYRDRARITAIDGMTEPATDAESPPGHASAAELMDLLRAGMAELPDKQAEVFWLSCVEGLPHQRIGEQMELPPGEVRVLLHRARTRLRTVLDRTNRTKGGRDE